MQLEKRKEFIISSHTLHVMKSKNIINIVNVWNLKGTVNGDKGDFIRQLTLFWFV